MSFGQREFNFDASSGYAGYRRWRNEIARRMFLHRFQEPSVHGISIKQLRGMEGRRVKQTYAELGLKDGVTWKGRDYKSDNWAVADGIALHWMPMAGRGLAKARHPVMLPP